MDADRHREELLAVLARHPRGHDESYAPEVRAAVLAYALPLHAAGWGWKAIGAGLPVSTTTIRAWVLAARSSAPAPPVALPETSPLRPVMVEGPPGPVETPPAPPPVPPAGHAAPGLALVTPAGFRLVGLTREDAAWLLGRLG